MVPGRSSFQLIPELTLTQLQTNYPVVVGHEIIGKAVKVGSKVKHVKVGDRVGVGAQSGSCQNQKGDCEGCAFGYVPALL